MTLRLTNDIVSLPSRIITFLFGLPFFAAGLIFLSVIAYSVWIDAVPYFWETSKCTIVTSEFTTTTPSGGPRVLYTYIHAGQRFQGNELIPNAPLNHSSALKDFQSNRGEVRGFEKAKIVPCYVSPQWPYRAVLKRRTLWYGLFALLPVIFVVVGGAIMWAAFTMKPLSQSPISSRGRNDGNFFLPSDPTGVTDPSTGLLRYSSGKFRVGKVVGLFLTGGFWNGIVSVFVYQLVKSPSIFLGLFLIPFVLIGVLLIVGFFSSVLELFNPAFEFQFLAPLRVGQRSTLRWTLRGKVERIESIQITLEGQEEVRYRRGTSTYHDTRVFEVIEVGNFQSSEIMMKTGSKSFQMPEITVPTFLAVSNKIQWYLRIKGSIPKWPDMRDEFNVVVGL